jgi:hypothetical protein
VCFSIGHDCRKHREEEKGKHASSEAIHFFRRFI